MHSLILYFLDILKIQPSFYVNFELHPTHQVPVYTVRGAGRGGEGAQGTGTKWLATLEPTLFPHNSTRLHSSTVFSLDSRVPWKKATCIHSHCWCHTVSMACDSKPTLLPLNSTQRFNHSQWHTDIPSPLQTTLHCVIQYQERSLLGYFQWNFTQLCTSN